MESQTLIQQQVGQCFRQVNCSGWMRTSLRSVTVEHDFILCVRTDGPHMGEAQFFPADLSVWITAPWVAGTMIPTISVRVAGD